MALNILAWLFAIPLLGFCTGLRTMTPIAVLCWFIFRGYLHIPPGWAFWTTFRVSALVFSVLAVGEYIGDKLPMTPNRTAPLPFAARLAFGGLVGGIAALGLKGNVFEGVVLAALGAALGSFTGFLLRREIVQRTGWPDWTVALAEDAFAVVASVYALGIITG